MGIKTRNGAASRSALFTVAIASLVGAAHAQQYTTWREYGGGAHSSQYSALKQIDKSNVAKLEIAWTFPTGERVRWSKSKPIAWPMKRPSRKRAGWICNF